jgi:5-hydroxyisourate hydrolase
MTKITTHVLDISLGKPAAQVTIILESIGEHKTALAEAQTNADGRVAPSLYEGNLAPGLYVIKFSLAAYFARSQRTSIYPFVTVHFMLDNPHQHFHLPLLISPAGYSTYRGS